MHTHSLSSYSEHESIKGRGSTRSSSYATVETQASSGCATPVDTGDQSKISRQGTQQTTPRGPLFGARNGEEAIPTTPYLMQAPEPVRTHASCASPTTNKAGTGLTPMASQLRLGPMASHFDNRNEHAPQPPYYEVISEAEWAARSSHQQWQSPPLAHTSPSAEGPKPERQTRGAQVARSVSTKSDMGTSFIPRDSIKALHQSQSGSDVSHGKNPILSPNSGTGSWPIMPGLPVVMAQNQSHPLQGQDKDNMMNRAYGMSCSDRAPQIGDPNPRRTSGVPPVPAPHNYYLRNKVPACTQTPLEAPGPVSEVVYPVRSSTPVTPQPQQARGAAIRQGVSPSAALRAFSHLLTTYEKSEILQFKEIWFVGRSRLSKIHVEINRMKGSDAHNNQGYDDSRGDYFAVVGDHILYRYEVLGTLGRGSFGQVLRCKDHSTGHTIALKIIRNKRRFQRQAQVEASILATLSARDPGGSSGIVRMLEHFSFRSHLCIAFELLDVNLYDYIKAGSFAGCGPWLVRRIARQVLHSLRFLSTLNIVHCDLKPENILLTTRGSSTVKVIDFGSSCYVDQRVYTYIQSRFYRAPEVILGLPYGPAIDIWSLACVLAELATGTPIFPGEDESEQLACIAEVLGAPQPALLRGATRAKLFVDPETGWPLPVPPNSRGRIHRPGTKTLEAALDNKIDDWMFLDFLKRCLRWDPALRLSPEQALHHEWLQQEVVNPMKTGTEPATSGHGPPEPGPLGAAFSAFLGF